MKGKFFSIFILFCFTAPLATTFLTLKYQKYYARKDVKRKMIAGMQRSELVLLKFTEEEKSQLNWEHSKEFEYKNEMYDIVETIIKGDTTFYWCWEDKEETALNQKLKKLVTTAWGNNPQQHEKQNRLQSFFKSLYFSTPVKKEFSTNEDSIKNSLFRAKIYQSVVKAPAVPPPEFLT